jgi:hypothetical protein
MQFLNDRTGELVGDLADISPEGFRLEGSRPVPLNREFAFRIDLPPGVSQRSSMVFTARSRWCQPNPIDSRLYDSGFEIVAIDPRDSHAFQLICERYGSKSAGRDTDTDYLWKT